MSKALDSARAKLLDPSLGALSQVEMAALLVATNDPPRSHGAITEQIVEDILNACEQLPRDKAKSAILAHFKDKGASFTIEKTWDSDEAYKTIVTGH
mgnify:CR=1 FL=1